MTIDQAKTDIAAAAAPAIPSHVEPDAGALRGERHSAFAAFLRNPAGLAGVLILTIIAAVAIAAPLLYPDGPLAMGAMPFIWPGHDAAFPLGTDALGRDVAAGIAWGARVTILVGLSATFFGVTASV